MLTLPVLYPSNSTICPSQLSSLQNLSTHRVSKFSAHLHLITIYLPTNFSPNEQAITTSSKTSLEYVRGNNTVLMTDIIHRNKDTETQHLIPLSYAQSLIISGTKTNCYILLILSLLNPITIAIIIIYFTI